MKNTGIWLDKQKALIVTIDKGKTSLNKIISDVDDFRPHGGSGSRLKGGPQDVVQDSKYLEREKHQLKKYFQNIVSEIKDTDALVIFGPAETNEKLNRELHDNYSDLGAKVKAVKTADSMTDNQVKAWVEEFFSSN